ncbi:PEPxxWA-CTERM sorting domain-containing protein [Novosphingobium flavum]|uniref:PEPxxWA-CTERM sorting domain-containing protein n=1 Tax=Novosphingobium aerophilum TaxID=2839843 RepID=UPI00163AA8E3|nr:PEPxxWA-CTERM sorting domain-containing protein [Novosphingobium aerophilum]MBC2661375.1 PEPxxWA-CTERM sorting domain-containing protein [Novosphingobium aerophilum]
MRKKIIGLTSATLATLMAPMAEAATLVDTGTPTTLGSALAPGGTLAGKFTLGSASTITGVQGYIGGAGGHTITVSLFGPGTLPSYANTLQTTSFTSTGSTGSWQGVSGLNWSLAAGDYWIGFDSNGNDAMGGGSPNPLRSYAYGVGGTFYPYNVLGFGVQITGVTAAVPEPSTWLLMICGIGLVAAANRRRRRARLGLT